MDSVSGSNGSLRAQSEPSKTTSQENSSGRENEPYLGIRPPKNFPGLPSDWTSEWETFRSHDNQVQLFAVTHHRQPWKKGRALVVLHGHGEHGGRYFHLPHYLQKEVDAVYCIDHRGHGRSEGLRGHLDRFDDVVDDAAHAIRRLSEQLQRKFGESEIHLLGHSWGGHIALRVLLLHPDLPIASASISAPLLGIKANVPAAKKAAAKVLTKLWGSLQMNTELDASQLSHDPEVIQAYLSDRLVHSKMTPKFYDELTKAMQDTRSRTSGIHVPIQFLVPLEDSIVDEDVVLEFAKNLQSTDKKIHPYTGFFHEPHNEIGKEKVLDDIASWIGSHHRG